MHLHAHATADDERSPPPQRRESVVTGLAVAAVSIAAVLAAVMHRPPDAGFHLPRLALAGAAVDQAARTGAAACAECGVVEAAVPLTARPAEAGSTWQMRIRMDDGSLRTMEQRGALAAGSRVTVAGGSIRVLSYRTGPG